jgi:TIGR03009 family protein
MTSRICVWMAIFGLLAARPALGQRQPYGGPATDPRQPAARTDLQAIPYQVRPPQAPTFERRGPQRPLRPPFVLTPQQEQQVDWVLRRWQQQSAGVKAFQCEFTRFAYDQVFQRVGQANQPKYTDTGRIWYEAPDKGRFEVYGERPEKWICDGKAIYEYKFDRKEPQLIQHDLPPEMRGKAISESPLPFLFGATAESLKQRYFLRLIAPPAGVEGQIWLEARPATQQGLADFQMAEMILSAEGMRPYALNIYYPNGNRTAYRFTNLKINGGGSLLGKINIFASDPFKADTPRGWQKIVEPAPVARGRVPAPGQVPRGTQPPRLGTRRPEIR